MLFWLIVACGLWLIFGSFGSVILSRRGEATTRKQASSILWGRSECPTCKHRLYPYDLIPLLSFLFQWGKCRYCHRKISWLYPRLELGSAMIVGLLYWYLWSKGLWILIFWTINAWILWLLLVYDVLWYEVHIPLVLVGMGTFWVGLLAGLFPMKILWWGLVFLMFFLLLYGVARRVAKVKYWVKEEGLGFWDVIISPYLGGLLEESDLFGTLFRQNSIRKKLPSFRRRWRIRQFLFCQRWFYELQWFWSFRRNFLAYSDFKWNLNKKTKSDLLSF